MSDIARKHPPKNLIVNHQFLISLIKVRITSLKREKEKKIFQVFSQSQKKM